MGRSTTGFSSKTWAHYYKIFRNLTQFQEKFEGPWFTTQFVLAGSLGLISFFLFSYCRTRYPVMFAPRTKLKGVYDPRRRNSEVLHWHWLSGQVSRRMKLTHTRHFSVGYCQQFEHRNIRSYKSLVSMQLSYVHAFDSGLGRRLKPLNSFSVFIKCLLNSLASVLSLL